MSKCQHDKIEGLTKYKIRGPKSVVAQVDALVLQQLQRGNVCLPGAGGPGELGAFTTFACDTETAALVDELLVAAKSRKTDLL